MKKLFLLLFFVFIIFLSSCSSNQKEISLNEKVEEQKLIIDKNINVDSDISQNLESNLKEIINLCINQNDKQKYCLEEKKLIIDENKITYGTCRSFAKYRNDFKKKESFCSEFGEEKKTTKGCKLENGEKDKNCQG